MAKGKKTGGRDFMPGQSGNPAGPAPLPEALRKAMKLNRVAVAQRVSELLALPMGELKEAVKREDLPSMDRILLSLIVKAQEDPDMRIMDFLLNRSVGPVRAEVDAQITARPFVLEKLSGDEIVMGIGGDLEET